MNILNPFVPDPANTLMVTIANEFEQILEKGAVGTPVQVGDYTMVPLLITTFGIGVGGGSMLGEPVGGGGGGGVIPCAVLIFGPNGVELKTLSNDMTTQASDSVVRLVREATARQSKSRVKEPEPA
ncbi:GerW family sporulation protein [Azospirillum rugosum]|uniref:Spore protein YtfJ n=1 Tax=Azospirillum rugosum TaxID=416170 RepID=A0ABS4SXA3_9PROT|nr:spore germination protein GerW family protein [Azospirillum rugosum]MBP2297193.1 putative spore protein YtfJ [Azospirillum rugosum]MDQ0531041.1 putative spore protein YtfJ [Azospirillum rugosum]